MKRKYKRLILTLGLILLIIVILLLMVNFFKKLDNKREINIIDTVENFNYNLEDRDTVLYKNLHQELKNTLEHDEKDYDKYAELIAKLFIVDLYTLDNKISPYDVGGQEFIYPDILDNYKIKVENTLYKIIESDSKRKQKLPIVKSIEIVDKTKEEYSFNEENVDSYVISLKWDYEKDYGYNKESKVRIIRKEDLLYIVEIVE